MCDGCDRDIGHGTKVMDCRQCNYYLCNQCDDRLPKKEAKGSKGAAKGDASGSGGGGKKRKKTNTGGTDQVSLNAYTATSTNCH